MEPGPQNRRPRALAEILDDSIVLINDDGSKQERIPGQRQGHDAQEQQVSPQSMQVHIHGAVAVATGVMQVKGGEGGKAYTRRERFLDTWVHKRGGHLGVHCDQRHPDRALNRTSGDRAKAPVAWLNRALNLLLVGFPILHPPTVLFLLRVEQAQQHLLSAWGHGGFQSR